MGTTTSYYTAGTPTATATGYLFDGNGQSNNVGGGPIDPSNDPNNVAYNPEETISAGPLSRVTPSLLRQHTWVYIFNIATQNWEPYEARVNAQGFTGNEGSGNPTYVPGVNYFCYLADWWDRNRAGDYLLLRQAGAVGQPMPTFLKSYNGGVNNSYHTTATNVWVPSRNKLPALMTQLGIAQVKTAGRIFTQGETEGGPDGDIPNWAANQATYEADMIADGYYTPDNDSITIISPTVVVPGLDAADNRAVNAQKDAFISQHPQSRGYTGAYHTLLKDRVHWNNTTFRLVGTYYIPELLGWASETDKYFFEGHVETAGNSAARYRDEFNYRDFVAQPGNPPSFVLDAGTNQYVYTVGSGAFAKLVQSTFGGLQAEDFTAKTLMLVVQQPVTASTEYITANGYYSAIPGSQLGPVVAPGKYIGSAQNFTTLGVLTLTLARTSTTDSDGMGLLTVRHNTTVVGSDTVTLASLQGNGFALLAPFDDANSQYAAKPGAFIRCFKSWDGDDMARWNTEYTDVTTRYVLGSTVSVGGGAPVPTTGEPTGPYSDAVAAPTETGIYLENGSIKAPSIMAAADANGLFVAAIADGMSGAIDTLFVGPENYGATIGVNKQPRRTPGTNMDYSFQVSDDGSGNPIVSPAPANSPFPAIAARRNRLNRIIDPQTGEGTIHIEQAQDNTAAPAWVKKFTYAQKYSGPLYLVFNLATAGGILNLPRTQSVVASNVLLPNGGILSLQSVLNLGDTTRGGYASFGTAGITTSGGFAVWGSFNSPAAPTDAYLALTQGYMNDASEAFSFAILPDGTAYVRVRDTNGGLAAPTKNGNRLVFPFGQSVFFLFEVLPSGCRFRLNDVVSDEAGISGPLPQVSTDMLAGAGRKTGAADNGTTAFPFRGTIKDVGFATRTSYLTNQEVADLRAGTPPAGTTRFSTLARQYVSDLLSPDTISPANPVLILDGGAVQM